MKLLFDENLSPKLVDALTNEYPGSVQVTRVGLRGASNRRIWDYARREGFVLVSKDTDFRDRSIAEGFPPKIVCLDVGNAGTTVIRELLRRQRQRLERFEDQQEASLLIVSIGASAV